MNIQTIDESKIFEVNEKLDIKIEDIGLYKAIIIDNFYKHPEKVRQLLLDIPSTLRPNVCHSALGRKVACNIDMRPLTNVFYDIITKFMEGYQNHSYEAFKESFECQSFAGNIIREQDLLNIPNGTKVPHVDGMVEDFLNAQREGKFVVGRAGVASIITMNTDDECAGGTAFFKFEGTQQPDSEFRDRIKMVDNYVTESTGQWEYIKTVPMKFNRLVMYPNYIFHTGHIEKGMGFDGNPLFRINQVVVP
jgi:hypothetical protein